MTNTYFTIDEDEDTAIISAVDEETGEITLSIITTDYTSFPLKRQLDSAVNDEDFQRVVEVIMAGKSAELTQSFRNHPVHGENSL